MTSNLILFYLLQSYIIIFSIKISEQFKIKTWIPYFSFLLIICVISFFTINNKLILYLYTLNQRMKSIDKINKLYNKFIFLRTLNPNNANTKDKFNNFFSQATILDFFHSYQIEEETETDVFKIIIIPNLIEASKSRTETKKSRDYKKALTIINDIENMEKVNKYYREHSKNANQFFLFLLFKKISKKLFQKPYKDEHHLYITNYENTFECEEEDF